MSDSLEVLRRVLGDSEREETRAMWDRVSTSELGPEDQAKRERLRPIVTAYLNGEITRSEYETRLAGR